MMLTVPPLSSILMDEHEIPSFALAPGVIFKPSARYRSTPPTCTSTHALELSPTKRYAPDSVISILVLEPLPLMSMVLMSSA